MACDYAVVRESSEARLRYAECLTNLARWFLARRASSPGISFFSSESLLKVRVRTVLRKPSIYSPFHEVARAGLVSVVAIVVLLLLPCLGLSLYSPIRLASFLTRRDDTPSTPVRRKEARVKGAHSSTPKKSTTEAPSATPQSIGAESIKSLLDISPPVLPLLHSSTADEDAATKPMGVKQNVVLQGRHTIWDETPMPLATPPKWRTLAIGAITGAIGMATGQIDPDDVDVSRKRGR